MRLRNLPKTRSQLSKASKQVNRLPTGNPLSNLSPQQTAKYNLIEISNFQDSSDNAEITPIIPIKNNNGKISHQNIVRNIQSRQHISSPAIKLRSQIRMRRIAINQNSNRDFGDILHKHQHRSVDLRRVSVTERWTESFKAGRKQSSPEIKMQKDKSKMMKIKLRLPVTLSSYLLLDDKQKQSNPSQNPFEKSCQQEMPKKQPSHPLNNEINPSFQMHNPPTYRPKPSIKSRTFFYKRSSSPLKDMESPECKKIYPEEETYWKIKKI